MRLACIIFVALSLNWPAWAASPNSAPAPAAPPPDPLITLMASQPRIDTTSSVVATASFDPPVIGPGEQSTYRVTLNSIEASIQWPDKISAPPQLDMRLSARGQMFHLVETSLQPRTAINYRVRAAETGSFTVPDFTVTVDGQTVTIPEARLVVGASLSKAGPRLLIELAETNAFPGQPVKARVVQPAAAGNVVEAMSQMQLNGNGFLADESTVHQSVKMVSHLGHDIPAFIYETTLIPIMTGTLSISAQGFTAGNQFNGPIVIQAQAMIPGGPPQYVLLDTDPVTLNVRPLPHEDELPGFTGAIGNLRCDPPKLNTNSARVGEPLKLTIIIRSTNSLARLTAPPPPRVRDWQVFDPTDADADAGGAQTQPVQPGEARAFTYTLIPLTEEAHATPAIPFSYFDPGRTGYVDLTIPAMPLTVTAGTAPTDSQALRSMDGTVSEGENPPVLSSLAKTRGRTVSSLIPLQQRSWFLFVQLCPAVAFVGLWAWDRRRRYLEQHPDILLRRRARRALRRERRALRKAADAGDAPRFAAGAVNAMRVACAPHCPAEPRALVCGDVLQWLGEADRVNRSGEVVRRFFAVTDAADFANTSADATSLLALQSELEFVLERLEARL